MCCKTDTWLAYRHGVLNLVYIGMEGDRTVFGPIMIAVKAQV